MNKPRSCVLVALAIAALAAPALGEASGADERAIQAVEARQADAWNRHDARAYADLFTSDADVVNVLGWWWRGRREIETKLRAAYAAVFADSTLSVEAVSVRFLTPSVAIAHVRWTMVGAKSPDRSGTHIPQKGIQTQTLRKVSGVWLIAAFQNTNTVPEHPFPQGAAPGANTNRQ